ncbi:hypothetical protein JCM9534A_82660 [Catenuloplanes indicus JCM 9534]
MDVPDGFWATVIDLTCCSMPVILVVLLIVLFATVRQGQRDEFPPFRRSGGYLLPVGAGVRLSGSVWACQADSYSSGLR